MVSSDNGASDSSTLKDLRAELQQLIDEHTLLMKELHEIKQSVASIEDAKGEQQKEVAEVAKVHALGRVASIKEQRDKTETKVDKTPKNESIPKKRIIEREWHVDGNAAKVDVQALKDNHIQEIKGQGKVNMNMNASVDIRREINKIRRSAQALGLGDEAVAQAIDMLMHDPQLEERRKHLREARARKAEAEIKKELQVVGFEVWQRDEDIARMLKKKFVKAYPKGSLPQKDIEDTFKKFSKKKWKTLSDEEKTPWKIRARKITDRRLEEAEEKRKAENADDE